VLGLLLRRFSLFCVICKREVALELLLLVVSLLRRRARAPPSSALPACLSCSALLCCCFFLLRLACTHTVPTDIVEVPQCVYSSTESDEFSRSFFAAPFASSFSRADSAEEEASHPLFSIPLSVAALAHIERRQREDMVSAGRVPDRDPFAK